MEAAEEGVDLFFHACVHLVEKFIIIVIIGFSDLHNKCIEQFTMVEVCVISVLVLAPLTEIKTIPTLIQAKCFLL